jgi:ornithine cyclodeaminase/alanine dehydrogenase-like protein (mu-crystallin family)
LTTLLLRHEDIAPVATPALAYDAVRKALLLEAAGDAVIPPRLNATAPDGWLRLMPAVLGSNGDRPMMGFKAMNLNRSTGVRYVVLLYEAESGELVSIIDAATVTRIRTAAVTVLACEALLGGERLTELGLFGSGYEATSHVEAFKARYPELVSVRVYSPRWERCEAFARRLGQELDVEIEPVREPRLVAAAPVIVLATKTDRPVLASEWVSPGTRLLSIGSTRLDLRELPEDLFARSAQCVCDSPEQVAIESGDVRAALDGGYTARSRLVRLADLLSGTVTAELPPSDLAVFKSVGSAHQDIAVSTAIDSECRKAGRGTDLGAFPLRH